MVKKIKKFGAILILIFAILFFYTPFLTALKLPIPSDALVGLYYPYRDFYAQNYPNGIPFKNFLITDPVRQTYVWKELSINVFKSGSLPLWNPYEMTGKPLLGNFQSGVFYPLNILFIFFPFSLGWSFLILSQTLLFGIFMFFYLKNLKLNPFACIIGSIAIALSGFSVSWLEWGNIVSTALWLPLILLGIDKIYSKKVGIKTPIWYMIIFIALICSFFAGHLQIFFYLYILSIAYFFMRWAENKIPKTLLVFIITNLLFILVTFIQWFPTLQFILLSSRNADQNFMSIEGWFIPWKHLIQFIVPDFFGNPSTLNYWGTWNYGELVGYIGVIPLVFSLYALFYRNKTTLFYFSVLLVCLIMALPTGLSSIPFLVHIPLLSTAQPTRLLFLIIFSLSVLSAFGMDKFLNVEKIKVKQFLPLIAIGIVFGLLFAVIATKSNLLFNNPGELLVAKRNIIFPFALFCSFSILIVLFMKIKSVKFRYIIISVIVLTAFIDQLRFAQKFSPFTSSEYLFPSTKTLSFLTSKKELFRVAVLDRRIIPPNFLTHYRVQTIEGYDPLYLKSYAEFVTMLERNKPDINGPYGFNRIITPHNYTSPFFDFLNVKYVLSLDDIKSENLVKVFEEGQTKVYENKKVLPRIFFVEKVVAENNQLNNLFEYDLGKTAVVSGPAVSSNSFSLGSVSEISYLPNVVSMKTKNSGDGYLVFSDAYYPTWSATIDGVKTNIYITNHAFRGVFVPKGNHTVQFKDTLF